MDIIKEIFFLNLYNYNCIKGQTFINTSKKYIPLNNYYSDELVYRWYV